MDKTKKLLFVLAATAGLGAVEAKTNKGVKPLHFDKQVAVEQSLTMPNGKDGTLYSLHQAVLCP